MTKNTLKRIFACVTAVGMLTAFAGCEKKEQQEISTSKLKLTEGTVYPIKCEDTLDVWGELNANLSTSVTNLSETEFAKELEKKTGVKVNYIHPAQGQHSEQFNLMIASNELPDVVRYGWYVYGAQAAIDNGYIMALNDHLEEWAPNLNAYMNENPEIRKMLSTDNGSYYVFPSLRGSDIDCVYSGPIVRKDWLDKLGMDIPVTINDWDKMLRGFKNELNVAIPLSVMNNFLVDGLFAGAYGVCGSFFIDDNGKVKYGPMEDGYYEFLKLMNTWYEDGLLDKNISTVDAKSIDTNMLNDRLGATAMGAAGGIGKWMNMKKGQDEEFELVGVPYPVLKEGDKAQFGSRDWHYLQSHSYAVSKNCKNIELAMRWLDYGYSEEGSKLYNFGIEGVSYENTENGPTFTKTITEDSAGVATALMKYAMGSYSGPFAQSTRVVEQMQANPPSQREAVYTWADNDAAKHKYPLVSFTNEENSELKNMLSEINTYTAEMLYKFIVGAEPLDNFEKYAEQIQKFNIKRVLEIYQAAYDRYMNR